MTPKPQRIHSEVAKQLLDQLDEQIQLFETSINTCEKYMDDTDFGYQVLSLPLHSSAFIMRCHALVVRSCGMGRGL